ncbi:MAG: hypothetical protein HOV81_13615 [Kofleriaceae bacterium]|nr:hypothetical protein [Kofleriaceae bacterium]
MCSCAASRGSLRFASLARSYASRNSFSADATLPLRSLHRPRFSSVPTARGSLSSDASNFAHASSGLPSASSLRPSSNSFAASGLSPGCAAACVTPDTRTTTASRCRTMLIVSGMIVVMGRVFGMLLLVLCGCNQLLGIDDVTAAQDPLRDTDGDGKPDIEDNCPSVPNPDQLDSDHDNRGDACDTECSATDIDSDHDGTPDHCDLCPAFPTMGQHDEDSDGIGDECDNCPATANVGQEHAADLDDLGDACDPFTKQTPQGTLLFDPFVDSYDPVKWTTDGTWSAAPGGDAIVPAAGLTPEQGLHGTASIGQDDNDWYVETAFTLPSGLSQSERVGVGVWDTGMKTFAVSCEVLCKPSCQLLLQRGNDTAKGMETLAPGTYVLRVVGTGSVTPTFTCEVLGGEKISLMSMLAGPAVQGVPTIFATTPVELRYVHAVR